MKLFVLIIAAFTISLAVLTTARPIGDGSDPMDFMMRKRYLSSVEASSSAESVNSSPRRSFDSRASTSPNGSLDLGIDVGLVRRPRNAYAEPVNAAQAENDRLRENFRNLYDAYPSDLEASDDEAEPADDEDDGSVADNTDDASDDDGSLYDADVSDDDDE